jgi:hypothetical protein
MKRSEKEVAPAMLQHPEARPKELEVPMATKSLKENELSDETRRTILREAEARYRNELLKDEERQHLQDRIKHIRRQLKLA